MNIEQAVANLIEGEDLSRDDMTAVMRQIMTGDATEAQIGGFLVALRIKGETVDEIAAAAGVMRELSLTVNVESDSAVDIVGTGGDSMGLFNVSTAASIVVAAAGVTVAKHGNRSVTSTSGSADVLEAAGVNLNMDVSQVERCINDVGIGFMFAPNHHSAMKYTIGARKQLKVRTIFNLLGPLTNPAGAPNLLLGVFSRQWLRPFAEALKALGAKHVVVVHSEEGLDEISLAGKTYICELVNGDICEYQFNPEDAGVKVQSLDCLKVSSAEESLQLIKNAFSGDAPAATDMIALNAGAALYAANSVATIADGVALAHDLMSTGQASEKLNNWVAYSSMM